MSTGRLAKWHILYLFACNSQLTFDDEDDDDYDDADDDDDDEEQVPAL